MATLQDRKNQQVNSVEKTVLDITSSEKKTIKNKKDKYIISLVFDNKLEKSIRDKAEQKGIGVATYIKMLVNEDLNK